MMAGMKMVLRRDSSADEAAMVAKLASAKCQDAV